MATRLSKDRISTPKTVTRYPELQARLSWATYAFRWPCQSIRQFMGEEMTKRRVKGEGSVYRRKDGRVVGEYVDANGRKRYITSKTKTKTEMKAALRKLLEDRDKGIAYDSENLTVGGYLDRWLEAVKGSVRNRTWQRHEEVVRLHLKPNIGGVKLDKLNALQVQSLYRQRLNSGLSARSVEIIHATLHKALKQAVRWSLIPRNITEAVTPPRPVKQEIQPLSQDQMKALLEAAHGDKLYAFWVLACTTGMRNGELLALKWSDISPDTGTLQVRRTVFNVQINAPKTSAGRRTIRLSKLALSALRQHRINAAKQRISEWVFSSTAGTTLSVHNVHNRSWKPLLKRAGLPSSTRMHDLRHSAATLLLTQGVPVKVVSEMLGHADVSITLSIYAHVLPDMQSTAADSMDEALG
jgi:integrase